MAPDPNSQTLPILWPPVPIPGMAVFRDPDHATTDILLFLESPCMHGMAVKNTGNLPPREGAGWSKQDRVGTGTGIGICRVVLQGLGTRKEEGIMNGSWGAL